MIRMPRHFLRKLSGVATLLCCLLFLAHASEPNRAVGAEPSVSVSLDPPEIFPGEPVSCRISVRWKPPLRVHPLSLPREWKNLEMLALDASAPIEKKETGEIEQTFTIKLTAFETGEWETPPFEIPFLDADGQLQTVRAGPQKIIVKSYIEQLEREKQHDGDATPAVALRDIKPPLELPVKMKALLKTAGILLAAITAAAILFVLIRRLRPRRSAEAPAPPPLPPDIEALQALARLELEDAARREQVKIFYSQLSEILRRYLGRRYGFDALEMTSSELLQKTRNLEWSPALAAVLEEDAAESDAVKFARYVPPVPFRQAALERARRMVLETRETPADATTAHPEKGTAAADV